MAKYSYIKYGEFDSGDPRLFTPSLQDHSEKEAYDSCLDRIRSIEASGGVIDFNSFVRGSIILSGGSILQPLVRCKKFFGIGTSYIYGKNAGRKVFLVANNKSKPAMFRRVVDGEFIAGRWLIEKDDIVVLFNSYDRNSPLAVRENTLHVRRWTGENGSYFGDEITNKTMLGVLYAEGPKSNFCSAVIKRIGVELQDGKYPSTGLMAAAFFSVMFGNESVVTVNFDDEPIENHWGCHDINQEHSMIRGILPLENMTSSYV